jgi:osmoprotectant transport system ATP-binding protein
VLRSAGAVAETAIEIKNASKRYGDVVVLSKVTLSIGKGETFCLIGPSGCGKSTTMRLMNRLVEPTEGTILINGKDIGGTDVAELRLGIGYVIQDVGLFAHYTIARNVGLVPELLGWPPKKREDRVHELLELVGLPADKFGDRYPRQLSGGQRQRAGIARALAADPPIVLLDEPFSALDPITRERLQDEFIALSERLVKTFVIVTHDIFEAVRLADRIAVMRDGRLVQCGTPREIVHHPADDEVAALLGRHRYQLKLMTMTIDEVCAGVGTAANGDATAADGVKSLIVEPGSSAWEALDRMETEGAELLRVESADAKDRARVLTRRELLGAIGGA